MKMVECLKSWERVCYEGRILVNKDTEAISIYDERLFD